MTLHCHEYFFTLQFTVKNNNNNKKTDCAVSLGPERNRTGSAFVGFSWLSGLLDLSFARCSICSMTGRGSHSLVSSKYCLSKFAQSHQTYNLKLFFYSEDFFFTKTFHFVSYLNYQIDYISQIFKALYLLCVGFLVLFHFCCCCVMKL